MYIDEGAAAPLDRIGKAMNDFAGAAAAGQFAVSQQGGDALLAAITKMATWLRTERSKLTILDQKPALGGTNGAAVMSPYMQNVASDQQGLLTQLKAFGDSLEDAERGIRQAMANYQSTDQANATKFV